MHHFARYMMSVPETTYVNPNDNSTCGVPRYDSWQMLRSPVGSDIPWPGFLFGQTPASIWYWCADQMMVQKALSAKSLSDAQGATILTGWIKVLLLKEVSFPSKLNSKGVADVLDRGAGNDQPGSLPRHSGLR